MGRNDHRFLQPEGGSRVGLIIDRAGRRHHNVVHEALGVSNDLPRVCGKEYDLEERQYDDAQVKEELDRESALFLPLVPRAGGHSSRDVGKAGELGAPLLTPQPRRAEATCAPKAALHIIPRIRKLELVRLLEQPHQQGVRRRRLEDLAVRRGATHTSSLCLYLYVPSVPNPTRSTP